MKLMLSISFIILLTGNLYGQINKIEFHEVEKFCCESCHFCEIPSKSNPCLRSCPRDEMITVHNLPKEGPGIIVMNELKKVSDFYLPVTFPHRTHAEMSEISGGCVMCHHYNTHGNILHCKKCHEINRKRIDISKPDLKGAYHRQCIDCHRQWSHTTKCANCHELKIDEERATKQGRLETIKDPVHPEIIEPGKIIYDTDCIEGKIVTFLHNEHTDIFNFQCEDCHANESCSKCHDTRQSMAVKEKTIKDKHERCSGCHNTKSNCKACHLNKEHKPFNHSTRARFALTGYHKGLSCQKCHGISKVFSKLNKNCKSCHNNWDIETFDHRVTGLVLDANHNETDCGYCHTDRDYITKPSCNDCHGDKISFPSAKPGKLF